MWKIGNRAVPAAEEQDRRQPADQQHRPVLGHEEIAPTQPGIFGEEPGHQFAFRFGQVERGPIDAGHGTGEIDPEHAERERVVEDQPVGEPARLHVGDGHQIHRAAEHHRNHHTDAQRDFVADHLAASRMAPNSDHFEPEA